MFVEPVINSKIASIGNLTLSVGDLLYASSASALTNLASVAVGSYLRSGGVTTAPLWSTLKLPNTATNTYIPYATSANTWGESAALTFDGTTLVVTSPASTTLTATGFYTTKNIAYNAASYTSYANTYCINTSTTASCASGVVFGATGSGTSAIGGIGVNVTGSGSGDMFFTLRASSTEAEKMRIKSTGELMVGTSSLLGSETMIVQKNQNAATSLYVYNTTSGTAAGSGLSVYNSAGTGNNLFMCSALYSTSGLYGANFAVLQSGATAGMNIGTSSATRLSFWTNNTSKVSILSSGEFILGASSLTSTEFFSIQKNTNGDVWGKISNTTDGTASRCFLQILGGTTNSSNLTIYAFSNSFSTSGNNIAGTTMIQSVNIAGLNIVNASNTATSLYSNALKRAYLPAAGGLVVGNGTGALATNATDGFLYIPTCAGAPSGVPSAQTGTVAMVYDTTNNKLYIYNGAWKGGTAPGAWS